MTRLVRIYPAFNALYYSFYQPGLDKMLRGFVRKYTTFGFPKFHHHCLAFIVEGNSKKKIYISAGDGPGFNKDGLEWCDIYAKVNIAPGSEPADYANKVFSIGPSFGIRYWPLPVAVARSVQMYALAHHVLESPRKHFAYYYRQYKYRLPLAAYNPETSHDGYVFFMASLWKKEPDTNAARASFIEACLADPGIRFEGGFAPRKRDDVPGFHSLTVERRISLSEYIQKTKNSAVVFNTPAVQNCHGWKLGEFLALGKAIISTPLTRRLPAPLVHGEHIHFVDGSKESIQDAVRQICNDQVYRTRLERGARRYYLEHLTPARVMESILKAAGVQSYHASETP